MDKIWYRNPSKSEVIGLCGRMKKPNDHAEQTKVERYFFLKYCTHYMPETM